MVIIRWILAKLKIRHSKHHTPVEEKNMTIRRVFTVGKDSSLTSTAATVANLFFPNDAIQVVNLSEKKSFEGAADDSMDSLIAIGHADTEWYGNYSANTFARQLEKHFAENQKKRVKHLYLIGCEVGLIQEDGQSLAQEIADELYNLNFKNIQVHSISKPEDAAGEFMHVEVIQQVGLAVHRNVHAGYINAYLLKNEEAARLNQLLRDKKRNRDEIDRIIREQALIFIKESNPVDELNKPHNIFIPNETPADRQRRIADHPYSLLSREQKLAIDLLIQRRDYVISKNKKNKAKKLNFMITQLKRAKPEDSQQLIKEYIRYLRTRLLGVTVNKKSNTLKLLTHLSEGCFSKAQNLVDKQIVKRNHRLKNDDQLDKITLKSQPAPHAKSFRQNGLYNEDKRRIDARHLFQLRLIKKEISELMDNLNGEIEELNQDCFFFLYRYEIHTKVEKIKALGELSKINDIHAIQIKARDFMANSSRVMRSLKTTRTRDLLEKIANHPEMFLSQNETQNIRAKYYLD